MSKSKPQRQEIEHNEHCWQYGHYHYECALTKITELLDQLHEYKAYHSEIFSDNSDRIYGNH